MTLDPNLPHHGRTWVIIKRGAKTPNVKRMEYEPIRIV